MYNEQELLNMKNQAEIAREQRISESRRQDMGIENQYKIDAEKRGLDNEKTRAQQDIDIATNPDNVSKMTEADIAKLRAKDEYGDSRFTTELNQSVQKASAIDRATDHTDYAGRALSHQAAQLEIDAKKAESKLPAAVREQMKSLESDIKYDAELLKLGSMDDAHAQAAQERIQTARQSKDALLQRYLSPEDVKAVNAGKEATAKQDQAIADLLTGAAKKKEDPSTSQDKRLGPIGAELKTREELVADQQAKYKANADRRNQSKAASENDGNLASSIQRIQRDKTLTPAQKQAQISALTKGAR
ncbi:hypothetical protein CCP3SC15_2260003 [Gammaproteobacteria bacterium]